MLRALTITLLLLAALPLSLILSGVVTLGQDWRTADRSSIGIAPDPRETTEAVVQVYAARALRWRGIFGVHTWIATKPENAAHFTVHQVIGWRVMRNLPALVSEPGLPDRSWFGNSPDLIGEMRGSAAEAAIPKIMRAIESYPYINEYRLWPGPNSNTFTAYIARQVPELRLELPVTAVGKDFPANGALFEPTPSGTGYQVSLYGLLGVLVAEQEGMELNLLGFNFGIDFLAPAVKLPLVGRLGLPKKISPP